MNSYICDWDPIIDLSNKLCSWHFQSPSKERKKSIAHASSIFIEIPRGLSFPLHLPECHSLFIPRVIQEETKWARKMSLAFCRPRMKKGKNVTPRAARSLWRFSLPNGIGDFFRGKCCNCLRSCQIFCPLRNMHRLQEIVFPPNSQGKKCSNTKKKD